MMRENKVPVGLDHIIFAVQDLEKGMDYMEEKLGIRPVLGGRHPKYGTHNALLALKPSYYLEVIAPDPNLEMPPRGRFLGNRFSEEPKLVTWVLRTNEIESLVSNAKKAGIDPGDVESGSRLTPDGKEIAWKVTDPYAMLFNGAIPFIIDWGNTAHPSTVLPVAGELTGFKIQHPSSIELRNVFLALNTDVDLIEKEQFKIIATIKLGNKTIDLS